MGGNKKTDYLYQCYGQIRSSTELCCHAEEYGNDGLILRKVVYRRKTLVRSHFFRPDKQKMEMKGNLVKSTLTNEKQTQIKSKIVHGLIYSPKLFLNAY